MTTELTIIKQENINLIVKDAPKAYSENQVSHDRCIQFGQDLLATIQQQGMSDDLDQQAAKYIGMAKATIKKMNEKRSPLTKLFDEIRSQFTIFENEIDPAKKDTVPYQLQLLRNQYAAKKRAEEERRMQEIVMRQQAEQARARYRTDVEDFYRRFFNSMLIEPKNKLTSLFASVTLDNYDQRYNEIKGFPCGHPDTPTPSVIQPANVSFEELTSIRLSVFDSVIPDLQKKYEQELESTRDYYLDMMPSKKQELERAAKASAEEAERIRQQMAAREAEEAARKEEERRQREEQERQAAEMKKQAEQMDGLFANAEASMPTYAPKASVKKRLVPLNVEAFPEIISLWWSKEGKNLTIEELSKLFKKQITFCEKCAKDGELIQSEHICYEDEVKAK